MEQAALMQGETLPLSPDEESAWVKAAQANPAEFSRLYRQYVGRVFRYFVSRTGSAAEAEDLTSQTFLEALEGLGRYHFHGPFAAWLFTIARRRAIDHLRRRKPQASLEEETASVTPDLLAGAVHADDSAWLRTKISELKPAEQELLRLRFAAGLSFAEMARLLGKREAAVKMSLYRLLERLKDQLENRHE